MSAFKRIFTAVTSPFRMIIVRVQRLFNINVITAKLVGPLSRKIRSLLTLRPQSREDYVKIGRWWVFKKLFLTLVLVMCAAVFLYFMMVAPKLPAAMPTRATAVATDVTYRYNDMGLRSFSGFANIQAADGKTVYVGEIAGGVAKGNGSLWGRDGKLLYEGGFDQNKYSGEGISYYPSGRRKYEGGFANNLYEGVGSYYAPDGALLYTGGFVAGEYSGAGKAYTEGGALLYEGEFLNGKYHGSGTKYAPNGQIAYTGAFFQGLEQGQGTLYSPQGRQLYQGEMLAGEINYRSLVHSTLADLEAAFPETPRIFYTDTESAFVYEQAGIIVTAGCRVRVDTWKKNEEEKPAERLYYMPGEFDTTAAGRFPALPGGLDTPQSQSIRDPASLRELSPAYARPESVPLFLAAPLPRDAKLTVLPVGWYVADYDPGSEDPAESQPTISQPTISQPTISQPTISQPTTSQPTESQPAISQPTINQPIPTPEAVTPGDPGQPAISQPAISQPASPAQAADPAGAMPDFIEQSRVLYFEIDTNIWQKEDELDKAKIPIQKITVFGAPNAKAPEGAVEFEDNRAPSMEDCVAIDFIRQKQPTTLPQIRFEMDTQNRLFVRMKNINYAAYLPRKNFQAEEVTYRYCYADKEAKTPIYYSIER